MPTLSPTQQEVFNETQNFFIDRLNQVLQISQSEESKDAFFFLLTVAISQPEKCVVVLLDVFYENEDYKSIKNLFVTISRLIQASDMNSRYIKAITDARFFSNQSEQYKDDLKKEFAAQFKVAINSWMSEHCSPDFFENKCPLLFDKYSEEIENPFEQNLGSKC